MIDSNDVIKELLEYYLEEQYIINYREIQGTDKKPVSVRDGIVFNKFRSNHSETMETLNRGVKDDTLRSEIAQVCKRELSMKDTFNNYTNSNIINEKNAFQDISELTIDEWIEKYYNPVVRNYIDKNCLSDSEFKTLLYLDHAFKNYHYSDKYNDEVLGLERKFMGLQTLYGEEQFDRYNLVAVDDTRSLLTVNPTRLYDKYLNRTFLMKNIPLSLCKILTDPECKKGINKLSVRLLDSVGVEGKLELDNKYIKEEFERGKPFESSNLDSTSITKLYSKDYHNFLWVVVDNANNNDITFEEICDPPDCIFENIIITQVLHCEYTQENDNEYYITHFDHEYIFYTEKEFDIRKNDYRQKGNAMKRMKNFKVDNSRIKLTPKFLYDVLACYFRHTELLQEYFMRSLDN